ncbi:MAG: peptide deformylase [Cyanobacteria bacterium P01_E01_bin.6]
MADSYPICQLGDPVLRQVAQPIYNVQDRWVRSLLSDLLRTLHQSHGVGIAAPQIGVSRRLLIVASHSNPRYPNAPEMEPTAMINPHLISHSDDMTKDWEGCLSVPGIRALVPRYSAVEVGYTDQDGKLQRREFNGFVARVFQHELDHLEGRVFLDRVEMMKDVITDYEYLRRYVKFIENPQELIAV